MELIAKYRVETDLPIEKAAKAIASEQSIGTWTEVQGENNPPCSSSYLGTRNRCGNRLSRSRETSLNTFRW